jgi:hypothetical protein
LIDYQTRSQLFTGFFEQIYWSLLHRHDYEILSCNDSYIQLTKKSRYPLPSTPGIIAGTVKKEEDKSNINQL